MNFFFSSNFYVPSVVKGVYSGSNTPSASWALAVAIVFLCEVSHNFPSLKFFNWLESRLMLLLKNSTGVHWLDEFPDDPTKPGGRLGGMSSVDSDNC